MILSCGEAVIDMLPRETVDGGSAFLPCTGGAAYNTAVALGRLGAPVGWFGGLSTDLFGTLLAEGLEAARVDAQTAARSDRPTTLAFVTLVDGHARYAFYDENTAGRMLAEADVPVLDRSVQALLFGGISLVVEPAADAFAALCARAGDRIVMLDPNIRPAFIQDEPRYRARLAAMMARADIIKLSDEDADWLGASPAGMLDAGATLVALTRGAEGVTLYHDNSARDVPAVPATVVDTVGAGDTFNAGLLAGLSQAGLLSRVALRAAQTEDLIPAATLGMRAAAITVSRAGANPPWAHEL